MVALVRNKNFSLLFIGSFVSHIGTAFYNFAVGWFILELTASPLIAGLYIATGAIVQVLMTPIAGVFVDRLHKVRILYVTDFIRGMTVLLGGGVIVLLSSTFIIPLLFVITIVLALNNAFFYPAVAAIRPDIVHRDRLNQANALFSFINSVQAIIGILLAGILYAFLGIELIFIINGLSFIISAISEMFIKTPHPKRSLDKHAATIVTDLKAGFAYIIQKQGLMTFMFAVLAINFAVMPIFANGFPYLFNIVLEKEAYHLSIAQATFSAGMLVGGLLVGVIGAKLIIAKSIRAGLTATVIGIAIIGFLMIGVSLDRLTYTTFLVLFLPTLFLTTFANVFLNVPFMTGLMRAVDDEVRGRVLAIMETLSGALIPIAIALAGVVLEFGSIGALVSGSMVLMLIPYYIMMFSRPSRVFLNSLT